MVHKYKINPLVMIGLPTLSDRPLSWDWTDAYMSLAFPLGASISRLRIQGERVADARNQIAAEAIRQNADAVLFIGDDVLPPPNLYDLLARHREDIVTGVYWTKDAVPKPYLWRNLLDGPYQAWKAGEYFEIDWCGVDATLIRTDVFRALEPPYFSTEWSFEPGQPPLSIATEDLYFYAKAKRAGFKVWADTAAQCLHQDRPSHRFFALTNDMPQAQPTAPHPSPDDPAPLVADIGAGFASPWFGHNAKVTRYDGDPACQPDVLCDIRAIPSPDETFDIVSTRHVLEHFAEYEVEQVCREWMRILKVGGEFRVNVPNIAYAASEIVKAEAAGVSAGIYPLWQFFGHQNGSPNEVHRIAFTARGLESLFVALGLENVTVTTEGNEGESLEARGTKTRSAKPIAVGEWMREAWAADDAAMEQTNGTPARELAGVEL